MRKKMKNKKKKKKKTSKGPNIEINKYRSK